MAVLVVLYSIPKIRSKQKGIPEETKEAAPLLTNIKICQK
jgi:hypothetical protein